MSNAEMRGFGVAFMVGGVLAAGAGFLMDPSVETGSLGGLLSGSLGGSLYPLPSRMVNLHALHIKETLVQIGGLLFVGGSVFVAAASVVDAIRPPAPEPVQPSRGEPRAAAPVRKPRKLSPEEADPTLRPSPDGRHVRYRGYTISIQSRHGAEPRYRAIGYLYDSLEDAKRAVDADLGIDAAGNGERRPDDTSRPPPAVA